MDLDGDGRIDKLELQRALRRVEVEASLEEAGLDRVVLHVALFELGGQSTDIHVECVYTVLYTYIVYLDASNMNKHMYLCVCVCYVYI